MLIPPATHWMRLVSAAPPPRAADRSRAKPRPLRPAGQLVQTIGYRGLFRARNRELRSRTMPVYTGGRSGRLQAFSKWYERGTAHGDRRSDGPANAAPEIQAAERRSRAASL